VAKPSDVAAEVAAVSEEMQDVPPTGRAIKKDQDAARRVQALQLRLAGLTPEQIADRMGISENGARLLVQRTLARATNQAVDQARQLENDRLDRAQASIWPRVIEGDLKAIGVFLKISAERSRINGLYAPTKIDLGVSIRQEMEKALSDLDKIAEEFIVDAEVVDDDGNTIE
jgi:hypothetical protein